MPKIRLTHNLWPGSIGLMLVLGLPVIGALASGPDHVMAGLVRFPPLLEIPEDYPRFSWVAASVVGLAFVSLSAMWIGGARRKPAGTTQTRVFEKRRRLPMWGWLAFGWVAIWWGLAWTRFAWFEPLQRFTFFPLWLGFVVGVNALAERRGGTCLMRRAPAAWFALFGASAAFWWIFEWLNRFVRNWHYLGVQEFGALEYFLHASLCFSTVLPAVAAVAECLGTHPRWLQQTAHGPRWTWLERRDLARVGVLLAAGAMLAVGAWPGWFYPAVWAAPLVWLLWEPVLTNRPGLVRELARGDWSRALTWMAAALICGFCWELWNTFSLAKWIYTIPGVERWRVFEMPLLGYSGYLPFGLECLLVTERLLHRGVIRPGTAIAAGAR